MKEFTKEEIDIFLGYIKEGILASDEIAGAPAMANYVAENVYNELTEHVIDNLDFSKLAGYIEKLYDDYDLLDEIVPFATEINVALDRRLKLDIEEKMGLLNIEVNRKSLAALLGLREWSTKEDIINEISNLI